MDHVAEEGRGPGVGPGRQGSALQQPLLGRHGSSEQELSRVTVEEVSVAEQLWSTSGVVGAGTAGSDPHARTTSSSHSRTLSGSRKPPKVRGKITR